MHNIVQKRLRTLSHKFVNLSTICARPYRETGMSTHNFVKPAKSEQRRRLYSPEEEKAISDRVAAGETQQEVANDLNVHRNTVANIVARQKALAAEELAAKREQGGSNA
jgi:DNA-binding NarL/FixJ family response regulator